MSDRQLRLALDVAPVRAAPAGVGIYAGSLATALARRATGDLTLIGLREEASTLTDAATQVQTVKFHAPGLPASFTPNYHAWLQLHADGDAHRSGANLVHYTNGAAPVRTSLPFVLTVHDLSLLRFPQLHPAQRLATLPMTVIAIARARAIIVPSNWVRRELIRGLRVSPRRVVAVEHAASDSMAQAASSPELFERLGLTSGAYLLSVGTIEPRKNVARLVGAFEILAAADPNIRLVLAGSPGWRRASIERRIAASPYVDRIQVTGYLSTADVAALMRGASTVCYVSIYEGYGLPVIEALALGAPVVTSNRSAMPQAAGGAAVLVDPYDEADIARGIREAMARRDELAIAGPARVAGRTWADVADEHWAVYEWALQRS